MNRLKEREKKKNQKEQERENHHHHHRAREEGVSLADIKPLQSAWIQGITPRDLKTVADKIGMTAAEVNAWQEFMEISRWRFKSGNCVNWCNFGRSLRMWHKIENRMRWERGGYNDADRAQNEKDQKKAKVAALMQRAKYDPEFWALCRETCANCGEHGCRRGVLVPPNHQLPRPCRPEECPKFTERKEAV